MIIISWSKLKQAPSEAPDAIVGVKNVKPINTQLIEINPRLADAGT